MNDKVYTHSINHSNFNSKSDIKKLSDILDSKKLLSLRKRGYKDSTGFSGLDYISLCDYEKRGITNHGKPFCNGFYAYTRHGISLAFDKDKINERYEVIIPNILNVNIKKNEFFHYMGVLGNAVERYSDLPDEVQIKDEVSLEGLSFITYPVEEYFYSHLFIKQENKRKRLIQELNNLKSVLESHNYDLDVYDIDSKLLLNEEGIEKILTKKY